jgi:hypothetical protein
LIKNYAEYLKGVGERSVTGGYRIIGLYRPNPGSIRSKFYFVGNTTYTQHFYIIIRHVGRIAATLRESEPPPTGGDVI